MTLWALAVFIVTRDVKHQIIIILDTSSGSQKELLTLIINPQTASHNNCHLLCHLLVILKVIFANSVDPDQTAPLGAV